MVTGGDGGEWWRTGEGVEGEGVEGKGEIIPVALSNPHSAPS